jgi:signal transduction histidine kinase/DNA-binding response OmpR family regulator
MITLVAESLFAVIFLRVFTGYLRSRDPIQRDVTLVFTGLTAIFLSDVIRRISGPLPAAVSAVTLTLLLAQPYVTLRLSARLRSVPRWLEYSMLAAYVAAAVPLAVAPRPLSPRLVLLAVAAFALTEMVAGVIFTLAARRRTGAAAVRLRIAAYSTVLFAAAILALGAAAILGGDANLRLASRVLSLLCGLGYVFAFIPPRWLRGLWSSNASSAVIQRLVRASATDDGVQTWQRYAEVVQTVADADAVVILTRAPDDRLALLVSAGVATAEPDRATWDDLDRLLRANQPVAVRNPGRDGPGDGLTDARSARDSGREPALAVRYARQVGARFVTALPLQVTPVRQGALLLLNRHRSLFPEDDRRLLAELGAQAGVLAQRGDLLAEQRHLTEQLEESVAALTAASQAKNDFLANMSHELRTPLNAIIGFSELMRGEGTGETRVVPADWVEHVHSSGRHLLGLINDILDLAKVEAGRLDLHIEPLPLDLAVADVVTALRPLMDAKGLRIQVDVPPLIASADPIRFRQILDNLLSNAIKFTPQDGWIRIQAVEADGDVELRVSDSGVGIDPVDQERVFEEFQQVGDLTTRQAGTGLGLALTRRLVQAHGGSIALSSALGAGSSFHVRLPAGVAERPGAEPVIPPATSGLRGRVLLIEDDVRAAELLRTYLNNAGYNVTLAGTGEAGIAAADRERPDAIMLDVDLPGIDGWEVLSRLKSEPRLADIPVFFATVLDERQAGLALGATDYFVKPIDHDHLLAQLARHVLPQPASHHPSVLVVEPDLQTRQVVADKLRADGIDVVACSDGADVLRLTSEHHFDLVLCDMQMPETDGFALLSALDSDASTRAIPVLALTAPELAGIASSPMPSKVFGAVPQGADVTDSLVQWLSTAAGRGADRAEVGAEVRGEFRAKG